MKNTISFITSPFRVFSIVFFLVIYSVFIAHNAHGQGFQTNVLEITTDDPEFRKGWYDLASYLAIVADSTGNWTIEDVADTTFQGQFQVSKKAVLFTNQPGVSCFWAKLTIYSQVEKNEKWLLILGAPEIKMFEKQEEKWISNKKTGFKLPFSQRFFKGKHGVIPTLPIYLNPGQTITYYFRIQPGESLSIPYWQKLNGTLSSPDYLVQSERKNRGILILIDGILLAVGLYHLILFFYNRQKAYLYFGLFVLFHFSLATYFAGFIHEFFLPENPVFNNDYLYQFLVCGFVCFLLLFSSAYLQLKQYLPRWERIFNGIVTAQLINSIGMLIIRYLFPAFYARYGMPLLKIHTLLMAVLFLLILIAAILTLWKKFQPAQTFLIAIGIYILQQMINVLVASDVISVPRILIGDTGSAIGALIFAFGLGQQFRTIEEEKIKAEANQKRVQEESRRLRELDKFKSRFYTNITHEFRTPLTIIQGLADQIRENPKWKIDEQTRMIKKNSDKLLDLINQMLDLSKLESGKMEVQYIQADIVAYLKYLVESFQSLAFSRKINISFHSHLERLVMDFEPEKVQRILSNLITNALKFTSEYGKITVAAREVEKETGRSWLEIKVEDSGKGIPQDKLPHIFDRFYQVDDSSIRQGEGTGLGLALVKELMQLLNSQVQVKSEEGKGTRFTLLFPIYNQAENQETETVIAQYESLSKVTMPVTDLTVDRYLPSELPLVLLVEDNADVIYYLRSCLDGLYQIEEAQNGQEGIDKALEIIPDLIVSDVMMPEVDGFELCEALKTDERTNHIPIVLLTAKVTQEDKLQGLTHGADAYLTKPFQKEELLIRLAKLIELRKQLQEHFQKSNVQAETPKNAFLKKLDELVHKHLDDAGYSVVHLSHGLGMSRSQLHRKLKALTDLSASQYIRMFRMNKAQELLRDTDLTIAEIGYEVGFKDPSHFSRVFTSHFGISPSETRR